VRPRPGIVVSSVVHVAVLAWVVFGFSGSRLDAAPTEPLPIDLITPAQFDHLTKGTKTAKPAEEAKVKAEKIAPAKPSPNPKLKLAKQDITPPPPPPTPPQAEKEPTPEPKAPPPPAPPPVEKKEEAKKDPPTPPALPVPAPRHELADAEPVKKKPEPKPEPKKAEPKKVEAKNTEEPKKPEPKRRLDRRQMASLDSLIASEADQKTPAPPKKTVQAKVDHIANFDPDKIAALIDRREPTRTASAASAPEEKSTAGVANGAEGRLSISEQTRIAEMVRQQVERCWQPPAGALGSGDLQVVLQFSLNSDGSLSGSPAVVNRSGEPYFQAAAESAQRAVYACSPLRLPSQYYDFWKEVQIKFDPRDMMGG